MATTESAKPSTTESTRPAFGPVVKFDDSGITNAYAKKPAGK